jgi:hypothetical protein
MDINEWNNIVIEWICNADATFSLTTYYEDDITKQLTARKIHIFNRIFEFLPNLSNNNSFINFSILAKTGNNPQKQMIEFVRLSNGYDIDTTKNKK